MPTCSACAAREAQAPRGGEVARGDLGDHAQERRQVDLEAAVAARHEHPVEAGLAERLVDLLRVVGPPLGLRRLLDQQRPQRSRALDQRTLARRRGHRSLRSRSVAAQVEHEPLRIELGIAGRRRRRSRAPRPRSSRSRRGRRA